jgi:ubiquinone/menaquinone biosynthesis C-methylase UbiE
MMNGVAGHPIFAAIYDRMLARAEHGGLGDRRAELLAAASGRILELGAGTGANIGHYPAAVTEVVFTEPDPHMAKRLRAKLEADPPSFRAEVIEAGAEQLPFADASFDTVVSTLVLCTVGDPERAAGEVARVLAPQGRLLLFEHVRDPGEGRKARWQDRLERPWGWFAGACHPNRDTLSTLGGAGFDVSGIRRDTFPKAPPLVSDAIKGAAGHKSV